MSRFHGPGATRWAGVTVLRHLLPSSVADGDPWKSAVLKSKTLL